MVRILLCCGGGFSSSAIVTRMKKELVSNNLDKDYYIEFNPFGTGMREVDRFDIVVCCPHLRYSVNDYVRKVNPDIPIYILPPKMYGMMKVEDLIEDSLGVIDIYKDTKINPVHFPGEDNIFKITRSKAYKKHNCIKA